MRTSSLTSEERILFMRRLSLFLHAGIPIHAALGMIGEDSRRQAHARIVSAITDDIFSGKTLADALAQHPRTFDQFMVSFIRIGEASGALGEHAGHLATLLQKRAVLTRTMLGAAAYPFIIVCATLGITVFLTGYAFPKILPLFTSFHRVLPLPTRILITITEIVNHYGVAIGIMFGISICLGIYLLRYPKIRAARDSVLLRLPIFGILLRYYYAASIARILSSLLERGVPLLHALQLITQGLRHASYVTALIRIQDEIGSGRRISDGFASQQLLFPTILIQMARTGEMTGTLPESMRSCAQIYEEYLEERIRTLSTLIEPVLMILMGVLVGFVALAIITPIYGLTQGLDLH